MGNIIKRDLVEQLSEETGLSLEQSKVLTNLFFEGLSKSLIEGKGIEIRGFGRFKLKTQKPRDARNPKTDEKVFVNERIVPVFKASKLFIDKVNKGILG